MRLDLQIEPVTDANRGQLADANYSDGGHCAPLATHLWKKGGLIVGACGVFAPTLTFWAHTQLGARDSIDLVEQAKSLATARQVPFITLCSAESGFHKLMPKFGFHHIGNADFYEPA